MISFLVSMIVTASPFVNNTPNYHQAPVPILHKEESFNFSKFLENNWVVIIAFVVFLIRLQNSVEDIKKDNKNQIDLVIKDFEVIKTSLNKLQGQIDKTANKEDLDYIRTKQKHIAQTLYRLIEFINDNKLNSSEQKFKKEYNIDEDN